MHEFRIKAKVFQEGFVDGKETDPNLVPYYTFHISDDGGKTWYPSMRWFHECSVKGQPKTYYVDRCIERLKAGRSAAAFGTAPYVLAGEEIVGRVKMGTTSGRGSVERESGAAETERVPVKGGTKPREVRKGFRGLVDGIPLADEKDTPRSFPTEKAARAAVAIHCFLTTGKAGRRDHLIERLKELVPDGTEYKVWLCCDEDALRATVDGTEYAIAWLKPGESPDGEWYVERVKPLTEPDSAT